MKNLSEIKSSYIKQAFKEHYPIVSSRKIIHRFTSDSTLDIHDRRGIRILKRELCSGLIIILQHIIVKKGKFRTFRVELNNDLYGFHTGYKHYIIIPRACMDEQQKRFFDSDQSLNTRLLTMSIMQQLKQHYDTQAM